jgi:hypothetical protein
MPEESNQKKIKRINYFRGFSLSSSKLIKFKKNYEYLSYCTNIPCQLTYISRKKVTTFNIRLRYQISLVPYKFNISWKKVTTFNTKLRYKITTVFVSFFCI